MSSRPATEKSALKKKEELSRPVTAPRPAQWWWQPYWQLARMHKFPVGSNLVWWPTSAYIPSSLNDTCVLS